MDAKELIKTVESGRLDEKLTALYGADKLTGAKTRAAGAVNAYLGYFPDSPDLALFSSPGRVELLGNHTDHNAGAVMAGAVNIDIFAVAAPSDEPVIRVKSEGYPMVTVDLRDLTPQSEESTHSPALIRGIAFRFREAGRKIGGFTAYTTSQVPKGSGLSSSAAFEVLIGTILNKMYGGRATPEQIALDAQFAENVYFGKPSGLMDQMACAVGNVVEIDFAEPSAPAITPLSLDLAAAGCRLAVVSTGGSHADLTDCYAAIPREMKEVAAVFRQPVLRDITFDQLMEKADEIRAACGDRALLRAVHFVTENVRVRAAAAALRAGDFAAFCAELSASGRSSVLSLQNIYPPQDLQHQGVTLALAAASAVLGEEGAFRVHGGGFGGTILAIVPEGRFAAFTTRMEQLFGEGCCKILSFREGACKIL